MEDRRHRQILLQHWGDQRWLKSYGKSLRSGCLKVFMTNKCKGCFCDCHCFVKEHSDMDGVCSCQKCMCKSVAPLSDEECESCQ